MIRDLHVGPLAALGCDGPGPIMVLVHGWSGSAEMYRPVLERWHGHRRAVAVDLPGHGSTPPIERPTIENLGAALERAVHAWDPPAPLVVVGWSMGGWVAMEYLLHGGRADAVAFVGIGLRNAHAPDHPFGRPRENYLQYELALIRDRQEALATMASRWSAGASVDPRWLSEQALRADLLTQLVGLVGLGTGDYRDVRLPPAPMVSVHGEEDAQVPAALGDQLAATLGTDMLRIPRVGHLPFLEAPADFDRAIDDLVARVPADGSV